MTVKKVFGARVRHDLIKEIRVQAILLNLTLEQIQEEALELWLEKNKK